MNNVCLPVSRNASQGRVPTFLPTAPVKTFQGKCASQALIFAAAVLALAPCVQASEYSLAAVSRADAFLRTQDRGKEVLGYVHFGADYHGHKYIQTIPFDSGGFALVYRFWWENDGVTDVAFICNSWGFIQKTQIVSTNAVLSQPFLLANASIAVIGHGLIELDKDKLSDEDRRQLHDLVNKADAKGLMEFQLKLEQVLA